MFIADVLTETFLATPFFQGFIAEIMSTFFLAQTVVMTAVDTSSNVLAPLAIGLTLTFDVFAV